MIRLRLRFRRRHVHVFVRQTVRGTGVVASVPRCVCGQIDHANVTQTVTNRQARRRAARAYAKKLTSTAGGH